MDADSRGFFNGTRTTRISTKAFSRDADYVWFRGHRIVTFKADLVVQSQVIVEVKARPEIDPFNKAQVLHYLKATGLDVGLLLNFGRRPSSLESSRECSQATVARAAWKR